MSASAKKAEMEAVKVFVGVGSNINKEKNIVSAIAALRTVFGDLHVSPVYRSQAVGFDGDDFYNLVVAFHTGRKPRDVSALLRAIELDHGRTSQDREFCSRTLDLDQLLYGDRVINEEGLRLPHSDLISHAYILKPLVDVAGDDRHPCLGQTYCHLYLKLQDSLEPVYPVDLPGLAPSQTDS